MKTFCTIITRDHAPYAINVFKSLYRLDEEVLLQVLVVDAERASQKGRFAFAGMNTHCLSDLAGYQLVEHLYNKYFHTNKDSFRWAIKPVFISYLLEHGFDKVIYLDADIYFYQPFNFLFDQLETASLSLTPHWRNTDPLVDENSFIAQFTSGIYNAGFIGATKQGLPALKWWAAACHYKMGEHRAWGLHDDQRYLDIVPVKFDNIYIIRHRGCNVGGWNKEECKRELVNGEVLINGRFPIVFIHFNREFIKEILKGHDALLLGHFHQFKNSFEEDGIQLETFVDDLNYYVNPGALLKLKWRLKLRTRIKALFFKLAQNI